MLPYSASLFPRNHAPTCCLWFSARVSPVASVLSSNLRGRCQTRPRTFSDIRGTHESNCRSSLAGSGHGRRICTKPERPRRNKTFPSRTEHGSGEQADREKPERLRGVQRTCLGTVAPCAGDIRRYLLQAGRRSITEILGNFSGQF